MEQKGKNIVKKGIEKPAFGFTDRVMHKIEIEERALSNLLGNKGLLSPSKDFTKELMSKIESTSSSKVYVPVISKKGWICMVAIFIGTLIWAFEVGATGKSNGNIEDYFEDLTEVIEDIIPVGSYLIYTLCALILLSIGLVLEQKFGRANDKQGFGA